MRTVRVLTHIEKLDDCFGDFLVRVVCDRGAVREIEPEALARLVGWSVTLKELAVSYERLAEHAELIFPLANAD